MQTGFRDACKSEYMSRKKAEEKQNRWIAFIDVMKLLLRKKKSTLLQASLIHKIL
jgi:hypothetical protein